MKVSINLADASVQKRLTSLERSTTESKKLFLELNHVFDRLQKDPYCGIHIPKS
jgi:hypothetical protein